jgi:hypothetical protein
VNSVGGNRNRGAKIPKVEHEFCCVKNCNPPPPKKKASACHTGKIKKKGRLS